MAQTVLCAVLLCCFIGNAFAQVWSATGSLNTARTQHTASLLTNGNVLVAGGASQTSNAYATAELYGASSGVWTFTGSLHTSRYVHTATVLSNGNVLVAGGTADTTGAALDSAEKSTTRRQGRGP